jgi:MFS family permease
VGVFGAVTLFAFDAVTFLIAAVLFLSMQIPSAGTGVESDADEDATPTTATDGGSPERSEAEDDELSYLEEIHEGYEFMRGTLIVPILVTALSVNIVGGVLVATLPAFAETLQVPTLLQGIGAAGAFGLLSSGYAAGSFLGIIGVNFVLDRKMGTLIVVSFVLAGLLWTAAVLTGSFLLTLVFVVLAFIPIGGVNILIQTFIQSYPPEELVGRVTSLFESIMVSTIPIGSLIGGAAASAFGVEKVLIGVGAWLVIVGLAALTRSGIRKLPPVDNISETT